ncbi:hypothetical protein [Streptomyces rubiginosohelvolus]|uniref:hypothetical protein n=1 Tax=Streptomyces rubiginosohelvolus TaxID=67362 RepID=UPI0035D7218B
MTNQIPRYGERVMKADSILPLLNAEYAEEYGFPVHGNATRYNHLRGLIVGQCIETDFILNAVLYEVAPHVKKVTRTAGQLHGAVRDQLKAAEGSDTAKYLDTIKKAVDNRNRFGHEAVNVVIMVHGTPPAPGEPVYGERSELVRSEMAFLNGEPVTEEGLLSYLDLQQEATTAATHIWIDLHQ